MDRRHEERREFIRCVMQKVREKRHWKRIRKLCAGISVTALFTGCVAVVGTPEGIRAYQDGQNGLVTNAKAGNDMKSAYWQAREERERQQTKRETWMERLFRGGASHDLD